MPTAKQRRAACTCLCHESGPPDLHPLRGLSCPCGIEPHRGMRFAHARLREYVPGVRIGESPPEVCRVTRVTATAVHYRTGDGAGSRYVIDPARFAELIGEALPDA